MESLIEYNKLFFKLTETFLSTGKTPISLSPETLPRIKPPDHMDQAVDLPSFTNLYQTFSHTVAGLVLYAFVAFFALMIMKHDEGEFTTISWNNQETSFFIIVNALEELLTNCSARVLKANGDSLGRK